MSAETRGRSPSVSQTQSTSRRRSPSRESVQDSADTYLKIIDISLSGQRRSIQAESRNADEIIELLKDVSPVPKDTARIYLTHDVTSLAVFNFSKDINEALLPPPLPRDVPGLGYSKYDIIPAGVPTGLPVFPWRVGSYGDLDYQPLDVASLRQLWENPNGKGCRLCTQRYTYKRDGAFSSLDFTNKDKAARMEVSVSWSSVAFVDSGSVVSMSSNTSFCPLHLACHQLLNFTL